MSESYQMTRDLLKEKLSEIRSNAHYVYALMSGLPKENFYILRYFDHYKLEDGYDNLDANTFSLQEFLAKCDTMHPEDYFGITFKVHLDKVDTEFIEIYTDTISISHTPEFIIESLKNIVDEFLSSYCEWCLRANQPFSLTEQIIERFGFTDEDVKELWPRLEHFNTEAKKRIWDEYYNLVGLDFIRLEIEKNASF